MLLATVACLTTVVPALAVPAPPTTSAAPSLQELERLRDQLASANGDLEALDAAIASATGELDEIEGRLLVAATDLAAVRDELVLAEQARADAADAAATATSALVAATAELDRARAEAAAQRDALSSRIRSMWKYGGTDPGTLVLEGLARSETLHDASTTLRTVEGLVETDHALVADAATATRAETEVRARVAAAQRRARAAEARAAAERDRVAALVARQSSLVAAIDLERDAKAGVLATLAADRLAAARLVTQLDTRVTEMAGALAAALLEANPDASFDGPVPAWAAGLPARGRDLSPAIAGAAAVAGVDARLFAALVWSESNFHPGAVSHAGAVGLTQLMPGTAAGLGVDPWDPVQNLVGGARYLRIQLERFGTADLALAAYNAGPGRVEAAGRRIPEITETQLYVLRVLERFEALAGFDA
ncbi:MAG: transglycosylase SLT domain-containing protein [Acidimicrobiales bacterium]|nr:transglycosylase SLT domain-containing protein [Acidimicrobiales bacterium]